jgi:hypothetical protein
VEEVEVEEVGVEISAEDEGAQTWEYLSQETLISLEIFQVRISSSHIEDYPFLLRVQCFCESVFSTRPTIAPKSSWAHCFSK